MKKLNVAIIGQGRSGRNIHGTYFLSEDNKYYNVVAVVDALEHRRERAKKELAELGFSFPDSKTNFLFATHESVPAVELFTMLRDKHIFVRYFKKPRIHNYLRITIGTPEEMERFLEVTRAYLDEKAGS